MSDQVMLGFPARVERGVADADRLAEVLRSDSNSMKDVTASPEYQELVRLKVILEVETSRSLSETARITSELARTDLAAKLASVEEER